MPEAAEKPPETESGAQPGVFIDPFRAYNFKLVIQGVTEGHFTECHGLGVTIEALGSTARMAAAVASVRSMTSS